MTRIFAAYNRRSRTLRLDIARLEAKIDTKPSLMAMVVVTGMTAGAALFAAGVVLAKLLG